MSKAIDESASHGYDEGCRFWPSLTVSRQNWDRHVELHLAGETKGETLKVSPLWTDLFLACGCVYGDSEAIRLFEEEILANAVSSVRALDSSADFVDEVIQQVRKRLLVGDEGKPPKIVSYAGRGSLVAWVRVAATRTGINVLKRSAREERLKSEQMEVLASPNGNLELAYLKELYKKEFSVALRAAFEALSEHQRSLLRLRFVDDLNIEQIGRIYGTHRATIARRIAAARSEIFDQTRSRLEVMLKTTVGASDFDSLIRLVYSQLDFSMSTILGPSEQDDE